MKKLIIIIAASLSLVGCATNGGTTVERVDVNMTSRKLQFVELDEDILAACKQPRPMAERLPSRTTGKIKESEVVAALVESYTNEVNCFLATRELFRLQRDVKSKLESVSNDNK
jgi:hypothetical protein